MQTSSETLEIGKKLVEFCKKGDNKKALDELYSKDIESREATSMPGMPEKMQGIEEIRRKNTEWDKTMEVNEMQVEKDLFPWEIVLLCILKSTPLKRKAISV